jgi:hypothetical protein
MVEEGAEAAFEDVSLPRACLVPVEWKCMTFAWQVLYHRRREPSIVHEFD